MKIALTTPTGHVGRELTRILIRAGVRPVVLARDPERLPSEVRPAVEAVAVDLTDADAVVAATRGVDGLYWVSPSPSGDDPVAEYAALGATAARAVRENRIARIAFQSSIGAEQRSGFGEIDGLGLAEEAIDAAAAEVGSAVLHLRCGFFFTNLQADAIRSGRLEIILPPDLAMAWVAPRDIAEVAATRLLAGWRGRQVQGVFGPEDLSWAQAARIVGAAIGQPIDVVQTSEQALREELAAAGLGAGLVDGIVGMSTGMLGGYRPEPGRDLAATTPTTLAAWAYDELRPRPPA